MGKNKQRKQKKGASDNDGEKAPRQRGQSIEVGDFNDTFVDYYRSILTPNTLTEEEFQKMLDVYRTTLPMVFRLSTNFPQYSDIEKEMNEFFEKIKNENVDIVEYKYFPIKNGRIFKISLDKPLLRRDTRFRPFRDWINLQTDLGRSHRQEFVSMIPTYFLDVQPHDAVLDMCAAPGSKTAQIVECLDPEEGLVFANDIDIPRCRNLVHNLQKIGTQNVLVTSQKAQFFVSEDFQFDKVLCDVLCTGDGTLRKNPAAGKNWTPKRAADLHGTQRAILKRGLELTKAGGYCVYSTCSMNPIENEAVVNSVLLETNGAVEIVDCSDKFPELKRHKGMTEWRVYDVTNNQLGDVYEKIEDVPAEKKEKNNSTMFCQPQVPNLSCCMRFFPQDDDSGGFFVTLLHKIKDFDRISRVQSTPQQPLREAPYINMTQGNTTVLETIKSIFELDEKFPYEQLFVRDEKTVHNISYIGRKVAELINKHGSANFYTVSCGSPIFTWRNFSKGTPHPYPAVESVPIIMKYAHKRLFKVKPYELKLLLQAGHTGVKFTDLSEETFLQMKDVDSTGALFYIPDTPFAYGGMTFAASCTLYLRKDLLPVELKNLLLAYPELADKDEIEKIEQEVQKEDEKDENDEKEDDGVKEDNDEKEEDDGN